MNTFKKEAGLHNRVTLALNIMETWWPMDPLMVSDLSSVKEIQK